MIRAELGTGPGDVLIGTVGRLDAVKNHEGLIRTFSHVRFTHPHARLAIIGGGELRERLQKLIEEERLEGAVTLTGERLEVAPYLHAFDIAVLNSRSEGMPLAVLEALSAAKPVLATDVGGVREIMPDGEGLIVPPDDPDAFGNRLRWLIDNPDEREAIGRRGFERYRELFSVEQMVAQYQSLYDRVVDR